MDEKVKKYLEENTESLHNALLEELDIFEYEKLYYTGDNMSLAWSMGYTQKETVDGVTRNYKYGGKIYSKISDEEYEKLLKIANEKRLIQARKEEDFRKANPVNETPVEYNITPNSATDESFASSFLQGLAWFLWIGGIIASIAFARVQVQNGYRTETVFNWSYFITSAVIYIVSGCLCYCMSQIAGDITYIATAMRSMQITERKKKK